MTPLGRVFVCGYVILWVKSCSQIISSLTLDIPAPWLLMPGLLLTCGGKCPPSPTFLVTWILWPWTFPDEGRRCDWCASVRCGDPLGRHGGPQYKVMWGHVCFNVVSGACYQTDFNCPAVLVWCFYDWITRCEKLCGAVYEDSIIGPILYKPFFVLFYVAGYVGAMTQAFNWRRFEVFL